MEGQVNRLKTIKRQMYGRAGFNLLRARVLPYPLLGLITSNAPSSCSKIAEEPIFNQHYGDSQSTG